MLMKNNKAQPLTWENAADLLYLRQPGIFYLASKIFSTTPWPQPCFY